MIKNKFKRLISLGIASMLLLSLSACGRNIRNDDTVQVVTDCFSAYDWVNIITDGASDNVQITLLNAKGQDMHSFQPSVADVARIYDSDILIYIGGESDAWMDDILDDKEASKVDALRLFDCMHELLLEEDVPGLTEEEQHTDGHGHEHEEEEFDEHVWLSVANSIRFVESISEKLCAANPGAAELYRKNTEAYVNRLKELDYSYTEFFKSSTGDAVIICDRFPFRYMFEGQGMSYYAAFPGCSAETEASFATIIYLGNKLKENKTKCLFVLENSNDLIANSVIANSGVDKDKVKIYMLDSLQSVNLKEVEGTVHYYDVMLKNLETLKEAFGVR